MGIVHAFEIILQTNIYFSCSSAKIKASTVQSYMYILEVDLSNWSAWVCELFDSVTGRNQFAIDKINYKFIYTRPDNGSMTVWLTWLYSRLIRTRPIQVCRSFLYNDYFQLYMPILCVRHNGDNTASLISVLIKSALIIKGVGVQGFIMQEFLFMGNHYQCYMYLWYFNIEKRVHLLSLTSSWLWKSHPFARSDCLHAFDVIMYSNAIQKGVDKSLNCLISVD